MNRKQPDAAEAPASTGQAKSRTGDAPANAVADDILVVGQRERPIEIAPRGLAVSLGQEQFAGTNAVNVSDLIKYAPNFFIRRRYIGDSNAGPGFRGTSGQQAARTLVMIDGFVVSNFLSNGIGNSPKFDLVGPQEVRQFDIVYGPYSSRYVGNSMGGIVNITTNDVERTEGFLSVQGFAQPFDQYGTDATYAGGAADGGFGLRQKDGPWSVRVSGHYLRSEGQPPNFLFLLPATGAAAGTAVTGAVIDPDTLTRVATANGVPTTTTRPSGTVLANDPAPIFASQGRALVTQLQGKLRLGYDDGTIKAEGLFAYWHNLEQLNEVDCYLRDAQNNRVCEGRVTTLGRNWTAAGANLSRNVREEYLAGIKVAAPVGPFAVKLVASTFQTAKMQTETSNGYVAGINRGAGTFTDNGPTGWYTGDLTLEYKADRNLFAFGATASLYKTDQTRYNTSDWLAHTAPVFVTRNFGKTRQLSLWGEDRLELTDALSITAGLRYDDWRAFSGGLGRVGTAGAIIYNSYATRTNNAVSPTLSAELALDPRTKVQLSLAMATRFPTVGELFQGALNSDGTFNINSFDPNLPPERSNDANLLLARDFGKLRLTGSVFYQRVKNSLFSFQGLNQFGVITTSFKSIDVTRQYGVELLAEARNFLIDGLSVDANGAWLDSRIVRNSALPASNGVFFQRIPRWRFNGNLRYDITPRVQGVLGVRYASRPNTDILGLQRGHTYGYISELFALDAKVNFRLNEHMRISAGVDNITNSRDFVIHPYPERSFLLEAGWTL
ncbi:TonB-dependent receptor [uncultured Sphingomonas sp.]|uniref:TonB-dependent receptor n=1 Tax=uncultured Sphingomonas sp. TaxID=158754 RepID=UPI0035CAC91F